MSTNYCSPDDWSKNHLTNFINFLFDEVVSAGGDGDGLWYSRFYDVKDIFPLVESINNGLKFKWNLELDGDTIVWSHGQECLIITNDEDGFKNAPCWQQILIKY